MDRLRISLAVDRFLRYKQRAMRFACKSTGGIGVRARDPAADSEMCTFISSAI